jgi:hypothetical protein
MFSWIGYEFDAMDVDNDTDMRAMACVYINFSFFHWLADVDASEDPWMTISFVEGRLEHQLRPYANEDSASSTLLSRCGAIFLSGQNTRWKTSSLRLG